jgi:predicted RNA-binding Zn-ribbon protein involved in translation (DUF1610 family)
MEKIIFIEVTLANASPFPVMVQVSKIIDFWESKNDGGCTMFLGGEEVLNLKETYEEIVAILTLNSAIDICRIRKKLKSQFIINCKCGAEVTNDQLLEKDSKYYCPECDKEIISLGKN